MKLGGLSISEGAKGEAMISHVLALRHRHRRRGYRSTYHAEWKKKIKQYCAFILSPCYKRTGYHQPVQRLEM